MYVCTHICMYARMHVCVCTYVCVHIFQSVCIKYTHTYILPEVQSARPEASEEAKTAAPAMPIQGGAQRPPASWGPTKFYWLNKDRLSGLRVYGLVQQGFERAQTCGFFISFFEPL